MGALQPWHIIILALIFVLLFGAKRLPDASRSLGRSLRIFKSEMKEMGSDGKAETPAQQPDQPAQQLPPAPVQQAPVQQAPVQQAPVAQAPVQQAPVQQAPAPQVPVEGQKAS